jgi:hypothetical protein
MTESVLCRVFFLGVLGMMLLWDGAVLAGRFSKQDTPACATPLLGLEGMEISLKNQRDPKLLDFWRLLILPFR